MKYKSTRDGDHEFSFEQAICSGYAPDGGLFVPSTLPSIDVETLIAWSKLTFPELAYEIMVRFTFRCKPFRNSGEYPTHFCFSIENEHSACSFLPTK
mmetsp:Transcript_4456/g.9622  ORF Transcript_4456/g.9622 Transcript_4456/m.9622 type:complete len:97 (-) Transcript_4456:3051-3341(-)